MARNSGEKASSLLRLSERFNEVIAFEFDLACTSRLHVYDVERETRIVQAVSGGMLIKALPDAQSLPTKKKFKEGTF
jgi:hypothetical protein